MRVLNERAIERFARKHPDSREWLKRWLVAARDARWHTIEEIRGAYAAADGGVRVKSGARVTVFDVGGNKYRMITNVIYATETIVVLELLSHAEYSKDRWKSRY